MTIDICSHSFYIVLSSHDCRKVKQLHELKDVLLD